MKAIQKSSVVQVKIHTTIIVKVKKYYFETLFFTAMVILDNSCYSVNSQYNMSTQSPNAFKRIPSTMNLTISNAETASILFQADAQWRGEKQSAPCDPSPPVLEGLWVINSTLTKSPLVRHQAHVVPEQIPFKAYMFYLPVLVVQQCALGNSLCRQPAPLSSLIANSRFQPADYSVLQPGTVQGIKHIGHKLKSIQKSGPARELQDPSDQISATLSLTITVLQSSFIDLITYFGGVWGS